MIFGVAAVICMLSVFTLIGCMGLLADKSGTQEIVSAAVETESVDIIAETLTEQTKETDEKTTELSAEDAAKTSTEAAAEMAAGKKGTGYYEKIWREMSAKAAVQEAYAADDTGEEAVSEETLTPNEAGIIILQEIDRIFGDDLEHMYVSRMSYDSVGEGWNGRWNGFIENDYDDTDERYTSYQFTIDAISGEILEMRKFQSYQAGFSGSDISWTEEEMLELTKKLVEAYQLMPEGELDWESAKVIACNESQIEQAEKEIMEEPDTAMMLTNSVIFYRNGNQQFMVETDWETGELLGYYHLDSLSYGQSTTRLIHIGDSEYIVYPLGNEQVNGQTN